MFTIDMFPAREGDCIVVSYGDEVAPRRILIDYGRSATYTDLKEHLGDGPTEFELSIVTHVDRDHIEGILELIEDAAPPLRFNDLWFNGYHHLSEYETFSARQGEILTEAITDNGWPWNNAFDQKAVCVPDDGPLPRIDLPGEMSLTLLSPNREKLGDLRPKWERECERAGIIAGVDSEDEEFDGFEVLGSIDIDDLASSPFRSDHSEPNGSSIAFIAEYDGRRVLFAGDAHVDLLIESLTRFAGPSGEPVKLDAFKTAHHGSKKNLSNELLKLIECPAYLISTNGSYFKHPDCETMARIIKYGGDNPTIVFNYRSEETEVWDNEQWQNDHGYSVIYPAEVDGFRRFKL